MILSLKIGLPKQKTMRPRADTAQQLAEPWRYRRQIERLRDKRATRLHEFIQDGVSLSSILMDVEGFSRAMAKTVSSGNYEVGMAKSRVIRVGAKERELFAFTLTDSILHGVVAELILERMNFSPNLYSYLPGKDWWKAVGAFAAFTRRHSRGIQDRRNRGLHVLRRDIRKYTDTIPVDDDSPLWPQLSGVLGLSEARSQDARLWEMVRRVVRPEVACKEGGGSRVKQIGVPTGSPISTTLFNAYLQPVDLKLDGFEGGYYSRYADDLIYAHPDPFVAMEVSRILDEELAQLRLSVNAHKGENLFYNGAGRASQVDGWRGATSVEFLGCRIGFTSGVGLTPEKCSDLLSELKRRVRTILVHSRGELLDIVATRACEAVNAALDPGDLDPHKTAALLRNAVTDREQLRDLDFRIALMVAESITGLRGPRAFRQLSYRRLREQHRLVSLYHCRNTTVS